MMRVSARAWRFLFLLFFGLGLAQANPDAWEVGSTHQVTLEDVDGNEISTSEGRITIFTVVTRADEDKARAVADLVPDRYLGDRNFRYVTLVNFERKVAGPFQGLTRTIIRHRLEAEARELKPQYLAKNIARDPRDDVHVIADFEGRATEQLGLPAMPTEMAVLVFGREGKLLGRWQKVPPEAEFVKTLDAAVR